MGSRTKTGRKTPKPAIGGRAGNNTPLRVNVAKLTPNPLNQEIYGDSLVNDLVASIDEVGLLESLVIDQDYRVVSGHRRLVAVKRLGWKTVKCEQISLADEDAVKYIVHHNRQRVKTCRGLLNEAKILLPQHQVGQGRRTDLTSVQVNKGRSARDVIAEKIGVSSSRIGKLLFIEKANDDLIDRIDDGSLTVNQAYEKVRKSRKGKYDRSRGIARPVYLIIVMWGKQFRRLFCDLTVASLLAPGNAPAIENKKDSRLLICTSREDWHALHKDARFIELSKLVKPQFVDIGDRYVYWKYHKMGRGHKLLTEMTHQAGAIGIHLNPDSLYPDGCIETAQDMVKKGKNLVLCQGVRFEMEGVMSDIEANGHRKPDGSIVVSMREATAIGVRNLHSETRAGNFDSANFGQLHIQHAKSHFPVCCYFEVPGEDGIVMHGHNWSPFIMNYAAMKEHDASSFDYWTIDGSYAFDNFSHHDVGGQVHIVRDSDELFLLGMTPRDEMAVAYEWRWWKDNRFLGEWSKGYLLNQVLFTPWMDVFRQAIYPLSARWHGKNINESWNDIDARADRIIREYTRADMKVGKSPRIDAKSKPARDNKASAASHDSDLSGIARALRHFWYLAVFWRGIPDYTTGEDGEPVLRDCTNPPVWYKIRRAANRRFSKRFITWGRAPLGRQSTLSTSP